MLRWDLPIRPFLNGTSGQGQGGDTLQNQFHLKIQYV